MWIVVLGCSTGVGNEVTRKALWEGYDVIGFHRNNHPEAVDDLRVYAKRCRQRLELFAQDAGSTEACVEAGLRCVMKLTAGRIAGSVRALVHSLSGASIGSSLTLPSDGVDRTMNLMAHSFAYWTRGLVDRSLLTHGGACIALSNPVGDFYLRNTGVIGPAKAALEAYVRLLAAELGGDAQVNAVRFSTVITPALEKVVGSVGVEALHKLHEHIVPRGAMATVGDIAAVIGAVIHQPWLNGAIIDATGGATSMLLDYAFHGAR